MNSPESPGFVDYGFIYFLLLLQLKASPFMTGMK